MAGDALKNCAVLAVHWNDFAGSRCARLSHQVAGDYERFLVRQRYPLSALERGECCVKTGGTNDRVENNVDVVPRRGRDQCLGAAVPGGITVALRLDHPDERGRKFLCLISQQRGVAVRRQRGDAKALALPIEHA
jgi:hypothetical protein